MALTVRQMRLAGGGRRLIMWLAVLLWILFFPNAFYIVTDYEHSHSFGADGVPRWYDILLTTAFACGGMFLGSFSLYLMHLLVRERLGWLVGWLFAAMMLALGSVGIYLGRFWRLNSWDVLTKPLGLTNEWMRVRFMNESKSVAAFSVTFFFFSLAVYCFMVSMARLHEDDEEARRQHVDSGGAKADAESSVAGKV
jgi:uncharacterized membrane protein